MDFDTPTKAHEGELSSVFVAAEKQYGYANRKEATYPCCTYCGSISLADALKAMQVEGVHFSGSDWKYGFPHKFYLRVPCEPYQAVVESHYDGKGGHEIKMGEKDTHYHKFYLKHAVDADRETIIQWNRIAAPLIGVAIVMHPEHGLGYRSVTNGWQTWGVVGVSREDLPKAEKPEPGSGDAGMQAWMQSADCQFGPQVPQEFLESIPEEWR